MSGPRSLPGVPGLASPTGRSLRVGVGLAATAVLALLALYASDGVDLEARASFVRRLLIWTSFALGIATPHLLLPDPHLWLLQLANPTGPRLGLAQLRRWLPILLALTAPPLVVALRAPADGRLALESGLVTLAVGMVALCLFSTVGERTWDWQDDRRGHRLKAFIRAAPIFQLFVPYGLVPGLAATLGVAAVGSTLAIVGEWVSDGVAGVLALGLLVASSVPLLRGAFDRAFYATSGFWAETFRSAAGTEERAPAPFEAVYWVPRPLKPSVWALLVSLDRRLPLGRFMVVGIALIVGLAVTGAPPTVLGAALALLIVAQNTAVALTAAPTVLPRPWSLSVQSPARWMVARAFVNLRWLPLVAVAIVLSGWLGDRPGSVLAWIALGLAAALAAAVLVTLATDGSVARRLA